MNISVKTYCSTTASTDLDSLAGEPGYVAAGSVSHPEQLPHSAASAVEAAEQEEIQEDADALQQVGSLGQTGSRDMAADVAELLHRRSRDAHQ